MLMRRVLSTAFIGLSIFMLALNVLAQSTLDAEFTAPDETYTVRFPDAWDVDDSDDAFVVLSTDGLSITVFSTTVVSDFVFDATTSAEVATSLASLVDFVADEALSTTIGGRSAAITSVNYESEIGAAIVIQMNDGSFGLLVIVGDAVAIEDAAGLIIRIVANYDTPNIENTSSRTDNRAISLLESIVEAEAAIIRSSSNDSADSGGFTAADALRGNSPDEDTDNTEPDTTDADSAVDAIMGAAGTVDTSESAADSLVGLAQTANAVTLVNYDEAWPAVIDELILLGFIADGGNLVFEEDMAFIEGAGNYYTGLARRSARTNVVVAGELNFTSANSESNESCGLFARVTSNLSGDALEFVQFGLANNGDIFYADVPENKDNTYLDVEALDIDLSETHHFLALLIDDEFTLFVDGELVFERERLHLRDGTYGIGLTGGVDGSRCEGHNIWAYSLD